MSARVVEWVLRHSPHRGGLRLVLLAIAHHAHDDGTAAWASANRLAMETLLSERQVTRAVRTLEAEGAIAVSRGNGREASCFSVLGLHPSLLDVPHEAVQNPSPAPAGNVTPGVTFPAGRGDISVTQTKGFQVPSSKTVPSASRGVENPQHAEPFELRHLVPDSILDDHIAWLIAKLASRLAPWRRGLGDGRTRQTLEQAYFEDREFLRTLLEQESLSPKARKVGAWIAGIMQLRRNGQAS